ncbi:MAG TPA: cell division ATP-binding protein FtsE, partial [Eubacterium sp.]|nr:cell division ATP-binding protein FtsE [Eubacterium sp.]
GVVFQDFRLLPDRNIYENIAFAQKVVEAPTKKIKSNVLKMLSMVNLLDKYKSYPNELSGGEQQR